MSTPQNTTRIIIDHPRSGVV